MLDVFLSLGMPLILVIAALDPNAVQAARIDKNRGYQTTTVQADALHETRAKVQ